MIFVTCSGFDHTREIYIWTLVSFKFCSDCLCYNLGTAAGQETGDLSIFRQLGQFGKGTGKSRGLNFSLENRLKTRLQIRSRANT